MAKSEVESILLQTAPVINVARMRVGIQVAKSWVTSRSTPLVSAALPCHSRFRLPVVSSWVKPPGQSAFILQQAQWTPCSIGQPQQSPSNSHCQVG